MYSDPSVEITCLALRISCTSCIFAYSAIAAKSTKAVKNCLPPSSSLHCPSGVQFSAGLMLGPLTAHTFTL